MRSSLELGSEIVKRLFDAGFVAYFAGGFVRDLLLGKESSEIDIATSAKPEEIQALFPKTIDVGISFGVVIVVFEGINFEVTTFRKDRDYVDGRHPTHVDFSNAEHDAMRRDFTINGMFYDPLKKTVLDYVGGRQDLERGLIRAIGEPLMRFQEDRLRMIRACRFSAVLSFQIDPATRSAIQQEAASLLPAVSMERIYQEFAKMAKAAKLDAALLEMHELKLLEVIFPELKGISKEELEKRARAIPYLPMTSPLMLLLMQLFRELSLEAMLSICRRLKSSAEELALIEFCQESRPLLEGKEAGGAVWAHFYAHKFASLTIASFAASHLEKRGEILEAHERRREQLRAPIERIQTKKPILSAARLEKEGIAPGRQMGFLLREGERVSIEEDLTTPETIIARLKELSLWERTQL